MPIVSVFSSPENSRNCESVRYIFARTFVFLHTQCSTFIRNDEEYDELDSFLSNPTPTPSDLVLCETSKGGLMLLEGGCTYTKHRVPGDVTQLQCVDRNFCKARLHTKGNEVMARKGTHPHESNTYVHVLQ